MKLYAAAVVAFGFLAFTTVIAGAQEPTSITIQGRVDVIDGSAVDTCILAGVAVDDPESDGQVFQVLAYTLVEASGDYLIGVDALEGVEVLVASIDRAFCLPPEDLRSEVLRWAYYYNAVPLTVSGSSQLTVPAGVTGLDGTLNHTDIDFCSAGPLAACDPVPPTTVAPTTVAPTTVAPTTVAPTTVAPSTVVPTVAPSTAVSPQTAAVAAADTTRTLAYTGSRSTQLAMVGFVMLVLGLGLVTRRRLFQ
jgi:LPXTG-motif cell wall-anchored protein